MSLLIWNNFESKTEFLPYLILAKKHASFNVGALEFLINMYQNVKKLLLNLSEVKNIATEVLDIANTYKLEDYYKAKLIYFLKFLLILNNQNIKSNQICILEILVSK